MTLDLRLWLLILVSALLLVTIEMTEDYLEQGGPRVRRPADGWVSTEGVRLFWTAVGAVVFPGIVLLLLNLALAIWRQVGWTPLLVLGSVLIAIGWMFYLMLVSQVGGIDTYLESIGIVLPLALIAVILLGDLLLLITFFTALPDVSFRALWSLRS